MCGRFTLRTPLTVLSQQFLFDLGDFPQDQWTQPRTNICPTEPVAVLRQRAAGGPRELAMLKWGLVPSWAKDRKIAASLINARCETVAEKPAFRSAFARRRCLILADGFYEWKKEGKQKVRYCFELPERRPFAFAGLWERWSGDVPGEGPLQSCTIITTAANEICSPIHERMPVILDPAHYNVWLDPTVTEATRLLPIVDRALRSEMAIISTLADSLSARPYDSAAA
jgi:putative SOS response-associated peptidase YedK